MPDLEISEARFQMAEFDSDHRYIRQVGNPAEAMAWMVEGPSIAIKPGAGAYDGQFAWTFECGPALVRKFNELVPEAPVAPFGFSVGKPIAL